MWAIVLYLCLPMLSNLYKYAERLGLILEMGKLRQVCFGNQLLSLDPAYYAADDAHLKLFHLCISLSIFVVLLSDSVAVGVLS